ncbi:MAG TPA: hypothetical protein VJ820_01215 [Propionibacteriaceae bacterium]|nr:hypothetical protein [Propionibacteriaceae bacterium]
MSLFARLTQDLTAIESYPISPHDMRAITPLIAWPRDPTDASLVELSDGRFVRVRETPQPTPGFGDRIVEGTPELQGDGHWYQTWQIIPPDLVSLKDAVRRRVNELEDGKISNRELARGLAQSPAAPRPRTQSVMAKADEIRGRVETATTAVELAAILAELEAF